MKIGPYSPEYYYDTPTNNSFFNQYNIFVEKSLSDNFQSTIILTFDTELFGKWSSQQEEVYPIVLKRVAEILNDEDSSASFCVLVEDDNSNKKTPVSAINNIVDILGNEVIELHGLHHNIKNVGHYHYEWFNKGIASIKNLTKRPPEYFAQPSWVWSTEAAIMAASIHELKAVRGMQSGPSFYKDLGFWTNFNFKFPYRNMGKINFPYQYVDWKFYDFFGNHLSYDALKWHQTAADITQKAGKVFMETIAHPFRLTAGDIDANLNSFQRSIQAYKERGIRIVSAAQAINIFYENDVMNQLIDIALLNTGFHLEPNNNVKFSANMPRLDKDINDYILSMEIS